MDPSWHEHAGGEMPEGAKRTRQMRTWGRQYSIQSAWLSQEQGKRERRKKQVRQRREEEIRREEKRGRGRTDLVNEGPMIEPGWTGTRIRERRGILIREGVGNLSEGPLSVFSGIDPELLNCVKSASDLAFCGGRMPLKYKLLMAMALDAAHGASKGVRSLAEQAMRAGATKEEVAEALRVAFYISGCGSVYTAAEGLREIFK
ncbi:MAG: carboxymuconolactone decarboxylase family protein [Candidatus Methanosuratincola sp.]